MSAPLSYSAPYEFNRALRLSRSGETHAGLTLAREAYALAKNSGDAAMSRRGLNTVAMCQASHGHFIEAIADAVDAYSVSTQAGDLRESTHALTTRAGAAGFIFTSFESGMGVLDRCLAQAEALADAVLECRVRVLRGMRLGSMQRFGEAEHEFAIAMAKLDDAPDNIPAAMVAINVAALSVKQAKAEGAREPHFWQIARVRNEESIDIARREGNPAVESRSCFNIGDAHAFRGETDAALAAFDLALTLAARFRQRDQVVGIEIERGRLLVLRQRLDDANSAFQHAFHEAELHRPTRQVATAATELATLCEFLGERDNAALWRKKSAEELALFERESAHAARQLTAFWLQWQGQA